MVVIHLISTTQFRMKMSLPVKETSEIDSDGIQVNVQGVVVPTGVVAIANSFMEKEDSWFISPRLPTDLTIQVEDANFTVHKYPLMSKCGYIGNMELQPSISSSGYKLKLENFPGGPEAFETVLKFCYGLPLDLNPKNIAPLRCASQYLEMSEELEDGNLISKTEAFLSFIILSSWKDAITVLESCENLSPWAENLQIVRRCCDSIAWKVSRDNSIGVVHNEGQWWFDDVANLRIDYFTRIVNAIRAKGVKPDIPGKCIMCYAARWLPGIDMELENLHGYGYGKNELQFGIQNRREEDQGAAAGYNNEQKAIIESLVSILPPQQEAVPCKFLLKMLNMAMVYSASPALISELEKRVGMTLDNASVNDLLIPNYKIDNQGTNLVKQIEQQTVYNIDVVQRIFDYFLMHEQEQQHENQPMTRKSVVSRLLDNYLAEIARDPHLSITKFQVLADSLPENSRQCHDGLYRAIDTYLKIHPVLSEHDRKRLCKTMNCEKLSLDARMHAAQNERLPLRTVIQVLFAEQVKMRVTMGSNEHVASGSTSEQENNQTATKTEIMTLKTELENVKSKMAELQKEYSDLQQEYEKITKPRRNTTSRSFGWRMIRKSALFSRKVDGSDENGEGERRRNSLGRKLNFRRRRSIS